MGSLSRSTAPEESAVGPREARHTYPERHGQDSGGGAWRWPSLWESETCATVGQMALAEGIDSSYHGRALRLTLLAPVIVEAILDDRLPSKVGVAEIMRPMPVEWEEQRRELDKK